MHKLKLSKIAAGFWRAADWNYTDEQILDFVKYYIDSGVTTFDHADIYGEYRCEELFGRAIAGESSLREKMQLVTKCGIKIVSERRPENKFHIYDTSRAHIINSVNCSLSNLRTDYIDLLLIHRPDPMMNPDETAAAFDELKLAGKVLHFGVSNFLPDQFNMLQSRLDFPLETNQIEFSALNLTALADGTLSQCMERKIRPMAWSPLAGGRIFYEQSDQAVRLREKLKEIGNRKGIDTIDKIALAFISAHPADFITVLGTGKKERVEVAVDSLKVELSKEEWFEIWTVSMGHEVP